MNSLLKIENLTTTVDDKVILNRLNLEMGKGEVHIIMGPNGAGKSTLANTVMGHPTYKVAEGQIFFEGEEIQDISTTDRALKGMFLSFQNPEEVQGVNLENFIRLAKNNRVEKKLSVMQFAKQIKKDAAALEMHESYLKRYLNVGFSGGEKKKSEILQMLTLDPKLAILDETDSGLDIDAVRIVSKGINLFKNDDNAILIITHNPRFLEEITPDYVHVLVKGTIVKTGGKELIDEISANGFQSYVKEV